MRIGLDVGRVLHGQGGVTVYTRELLRALASDGVPHEVVCFDLDEGQTDRTALEASLGGLPDRVSLRSASRHELASLDVFHAPSYRLPPVGCERTVFTLHDLTTLSHPATHLLDNRIRTLVGIVGAVTRNALVLAVSKATREQAAALLHLPESTTEVLPPILDPRFGPSSDPELDREILGRLQLPSRFFLAVGSLEPRKNLGRLVEAWSTLPEILRREHPLVLQAATGWRQTELRGKLESLGQREPLHVLRQPLAAEDLAALYRAATALVFPSLAEGFGLPLTEAFACGTPVVTSNRSSMPEVAGGAALLIPPESVPELAGAMKQIAEDEQLRQHLGSLGSKRAETFRAAALLPRYLELYERLQR